MRCRNCDRLIIALDYSSAAEAYALVHEIGDLVSFFKVGMQLYYAEGPAIIRRLKKMGVKIFLDLKMHDIPNTVAGAAEEIVRQEVDMFNIHLSGGCKMVEAALERVGRMVKERSCSRPLVLGVTVLTSLNEVLLQKELGVSRSLEEHVLSLARMGQAAGLDGVVASPQEVSILRSSLDRRFLIVTPGVRPRWAATDDQQRILTPGEALKAGADYLVIGRPVTKSVSPRETLKRIIKEIDGGVQLC